MHVSELEGSLKDAVDGEVRFDSSSRALYATDASNYRQPPIGVVIPRSVDDVVAAHQVCHQFAAPLLPRGCGTSLSGEAVNYAVVLDFSKYLDHVLFEHERQQHLHGEALAQLPEGKAWVLIEFGGDSKADADAKARELMARLQRGPEPPRGTSLLDDPAQESRLSALRHAGLAATSFPAGGEDHWPGWEDSAVAPEHMAAYLRDLRGLYDRYGYRGATYGHLGDGCVHARHVSQRSSGRRHGRQLPRRARRGQERGDFDGSLPHRAARPDRRGPEAPRNSHGAVGRRAQPHQAGHHLPGRS